jgi:ABC-type antimicrobial peptide transport system permease subunit
MNNNFIINVIIAIVGVIVGVGLTLAFLWLRSKAMEANN